MANKSKDLILEDTLSPQKAFKAVVRVRIMGAGGELAYAFGIGTAELLKGIREHASLNKSAQAMGMAYSKAWKSVNGTEECLGLRLIERKGAKGSSLTEAGESFLALYDRICTAAQEAAERVLQEVWIEGEAGDGVGGFDV